MSRQLIGVLFVFLKQERSMQGGNYKKELIGKLAGKRRKYIHRLAGLK